MFVFRGHWAHAHDVEQDHFMALAAMYVEAEPRYRQVAWLRDWQAFWLDATGAQGNGCSDLRADEYLLDDARVAEFRAFLRDYEAWCTAVGPALDLAVGIGPDKLVAFTRKVDAVLVGDTSHPAVNASTP
ncbi:hypothetical protein [Phytohabitans rumicis]|uniref:Uncharacterized protein n=1 Tax=Phytohabitans rumicis TaxID=1076125 RepID=A0A6V8LIG9_9ACTN|nr:hypothetical protein [Phytohabitans rumicis]GFJ95984.1 hypothetical protein Prum_096260 [Phytohabitans rumicis]